MTLSLVVAGRTRVFVSTDHRLTTLTADGRTIISDTWPKDITVGEVGGLQARIGYVGVGGLGAESTWQWLTRVIEAARGDRPWTTGDLCSYLAASGADWIEPSLSGNEDKLQLVLIIAAAEGATLRTALVSNAIDNIGGHAIQLGRGRQRFSVHELELPSAHAIGSGAWCIDESELESLSIEVDSESDDRMIFDRIARVSWLAAQAEDTVGKTCSVHLGRADGSSARLNYMEDGDQGGVAVDETIFMMGDQVVRLSDILKKLPSDVQAMIGFDPGSGALPRMVQSATNANAPPADSSLQVQKHQS